MRGAYVDFLLRIFFTTRSLTPGRLRPGSCRKTDKGSAFLRSLPAHPLSCCARGLMSGVEAGPDFDGPEASKKPEVNYVGVAGRPAPPKPWERNTGAAGRTSTPLGPSSASDGQPKPWEQSQGLLVIRLAACEEAEQQLVQRARVLKRSIHCDRYGKFSYTCCNLSFDGPPPCTAMGA